MYDGVRIAICKMADFFVSSCNDTSTLLEVREIASDPAKWRYAHALFQRIRQKTLRADADKNVFNQHQYCFEEICAKTLFNLSDHNDPLCREFPAPFDEDSAFYVVPFAIALAKQIGKLEEFIAAVLSSETK